MFHILNWLKLDVPVIVGWYLDESYGVLMPSEVWNKPVADIDDKIKRYTPRNMAGWETVCEDLLEAGWPRGRVVSLRFWIEMAIHNQKLLDDEAFGEETLAKLMTRFNDPKITIITGNLNNLMALLQFGTTWSNVIHQHGNLMPVSNGLFFYIIGTMSEFKTTSYFDTKVREYIEQLIEEDDDWHLQLDEAHLRIIKVALTRSLENEQS
jgi:hypothetical protein